MTIKGYNYWSGATSEGVQMTIRIEGGSNTPHPELAIRTQYFGGGWSDWKYVRLYNKPQHNYSDEDQPTT